MMTGLATWWLRQLRDLLGVTPATDGFAKNALVIESVDPERVAVIRRRNGREMIAAGRYHLDPPGLALLQRAVRDVPRPKPVILRLPQDVLLETQVTLPLLAERDPARVLGYEMDRLTPFSAADVFWNFSVVQRDRAAGLLRLRLFLVPRQDVQQVLTTLARIGVVPDVLEIPMPPGPPRLLALAPAPRSGMRRVVPALATAMAATCAILALVAAAQPFVLQSLALSRNAADLAELRPRIAQVEALRRRIAGQTAGNDVIEAERGRTGDAIGVLATITDILPDDAFLTGFTLAQKKISLDGQAAGAARLIAVLAADPTIRNPAFAAPVTRAAGGRADLFSIHAEIAP